jgi:hypothetical protein
MFDLMFTCLLPVMIYMFAQMFTCLLLVMIYMFTLHILMSFN